MSLRVFVYSSSEHLRIAVAGHLADDWDVLPVERPPSAATVTHGHVLVTVVADCPPDLCRELVAAGARVVLLAPVARPEEHAEYISAGASGYVAMTLIGDHLRTAVAEIARVASADPGDPELQ